jgi:hypothetical protein
VETGARNWLELGNSDEKLVGVIPSLWETLFSGFLVSRKHPGFKVNHGPHHMGPSVSKKQALKSGGGGVVIRKCRKNQTML